MQGVGEYSESGFWTINNLFCFKSTRPDMNSARSRNGPQCHYTPDAAKLAPHHHRGEANCSVSHIFFQYQQIN